MKLKTKTATLLIAILMISAFAVTMTVSALVQPIPYLVQDSLLGSATWSTTQVTSGLYSVYIDTGPNVFPNPAGMGRVRFMMPEGTTLGDIDTMSWEYFLEEGYPPHVDIYLDTDGNPGADDCLTFEYANNCENPTDPPAYGALPGDWYTTFSDDGTGLAVVDDSAIAWPDSGINTELFSLAVWKAGRTTSGDNHIDAATPVILLQFQMHSDLIQSKAYIDDIEINGYTYDLEPSATVGMTVTVEAYVPPFVSISVSSTSIDFGIIVQGESSIPEESPIIVTNTGTLAAVVTPDLIEDGSFYQGSLMLAGKAYGAWGEIPMATTGIVVGANEEVSIELVIPQNADVGEHTATLVFWAEQTP